MSEDWAAIAAEVSGAIASVGFAATIQSEATGAAETPWGAGTPVVPAPVTVTVIDDGVRNIYAPGGLLVRVARVLTVGAVGYTPVISDKITVRGRELEILAVKPLAPGGVDLLFDLEVEA